MNKRERQDMKELKNLERFDNSHSNWITRYKDILPIITSFVILIALFILYIVIGKVLFSSELLFLGIWIMVGEAVEFLIYDKHYHRWEWIKAKLKHDGKQFDPLICDNQNNLLGLMVRIRE